MSKRSKNPRLYVTDTLIEGDEIALPRSQSHYLFSVMRCKPGSSVRLFNERDGEWLCTITSASNKAVTVSCDENIADAHSLPDIDYLFAPLKSARLDYMVQKATEMGVRRICPVFTERTVPAKINLDRLQSNVIEAAEQCGMVAIPQIVAGRSLSQTLEDWDPARRLIYCDEAAPGASPQSALSKIPSGPVAVLIGPEGGFSPTEQEILRGLEYVVPISLGPRIMRADTAAVAALAIVQSVLGDWGNKQD